MEIPLLLDMKRKKIQVGPGVLVTAAFIGPGTLTVCTLAGVQTDTGLLWALLLSVLITVFVQNIAARISWFSGKGLAETVQTQTQNRYVRSGLLGLILIAICMGNAAYEGGNITGALLGFQQFTGLSPWTPVGWGVDLVPLLIGVSAGVLLWHGTVQLVKNLLIGVVLLMSLSFLITAFYVQPDWVSVLRGLFVPQWAGQNFSLVVSIMGTTIVPYNLFLHAALIKKERDNYSQFSKIQWDTILSVGFGGLISLCIIVTAASSGLEHVQSAADLGKGLAPLYGAFAAYLIGFGLFAAGFSSAITAPLAAAYVVSECFGWSGKAGAKRAKIVALAVLLIGVVFASLQLKPIEIIRLAQWANGLLLPVVGIFLLWLLAQKQMQSQYRNPIIMRFILILIVCFFGFLAVKSLGLLG